MCHVLMQKFYLIMELVHRLKISQDLLKQGLGQLLPSPRSTSGKQTNQNIDLINSMMTALLEYYS